MCSFIWIIACFAATIGLSAPIQPTSGVYTPSVRAMLALLAVGACLLWPIARLAYARGAWTPARVALDMITIVVAFHAILWPLHLVTYWTAAQMMAIDLLLRPAPGQMTAAPAPAAAAPVAPVTPPAAGTAQPETATATDPRPAMGMNDGMRMEMRRIPRGELQAPLTRVFATSLASGTMAPADRTYLAGIVARQTGLPQAEAEKRVDEAYAAAKDAEAKARAAADKARKMGAIAAFLAAATLLIAAAAACAGAALGGRHRDEQVATRLFGASRFW